MSTYILYIMQFVISFLEIWLCNQFLFCTIFEKEFLCKREKIILIINIIVSGSLLAINRNILFFSNGMMIIIIALGCLSAIYIEKKKRILCILLITLYHLSLALIDFFFAFISMIFLQQDFEQIVFWYTNSLWKCVIYFLARSVLLIFVFLFKKKNIDRLRMVEFREILFMIDVVLFLLVKQYHSKLEEMSGGIIGMNGGIASISLLSILLITIIIFVLLVKNITIQKEKELLIVRDEMAKQNYLELEVAYEQSRRMIHDIKNHFLVLKDYEKQKNYEGIRDYLMKIENNYNEICIRSWTGNRIIDLIIEQKKEMAKKQGIYFEMDIIPILKWNMDDSELCSLFGNLLDNSIEACEKIKDSEKIVWIEVKKQGHMTFISIKNTIGETPIMKNNRPITNKSDKRNHGYGVKNIDRIINKYEGEILYQVIGNTFQVSITLFNT